MLIARGYCPSSQDPGTASAVKLDPVTIVRESLALRQRVFPARVATRQLETLGPTLVRMRAPCYQSHPINASNKPLHTTISAPSSPTNPAVTLTRPLIRQTSYQNFPAQGTIRGGHTHRETIHSSETARTFSSPLRICPGIRKATALNSRYRAAALRYPHCKTLAC